MDEYNSGMDPEVKKYFRKILNSFSVGLLWMISMATAGLFFQLGIVEHGFRWYNFVFYGIAFISFAGLIYFLYKTWRRS